MHLSFTWTFEFYRVVCVHLIFACLWAPVGITDPYYERAAEHRWSCSIRDLSSWLTSDTKIPQSSEIENGSPQFFWWIERFLYFNASTLKNSVVLLFPFLLFCKKKNKVAFKNVQSETEWEKLEWQAETSHHGMLK